MKERSGITSLRDDGPGYDHDDWPVELGFKVADNLFGDFTEGVQ